MKVMIGSDPEYFLYDPKLGTHVPAELALMSENGEVNRPFYDGFQAEVTTVPVDDMDQVKAHLQEAVKAVCEIREYGLEPVAQPTVKVRPDILASAPPSVFAFGCSPSLNAYTEEVRNSEVIHRLHEKSRDIMMAGGHIHLGMPKGELKMEPSKKGLPFAAVFTTQYPSIIRMFETVGVTLLTPVECSNGEKSLYSKRRKFYGLSGEYRQTKYGIEMRSPSCAWMMSPELAEMIYASAAVAYFSVYTNTHTKVIQKISWEELKRAINTSNIDACLKINKMATDILTAEFGNSSDMVVDGETKYTGIWDRIKGVFERAAKKVDFYKEYPRMATAWEV